MSTINIIILVDVIGALADKTLLNKNLCMMDNSPYSSSHQGTAHLHTLCSPGQLVQWTIYAIDLQTPIAIRNIRFIGAKNQAGFQQNITNPATDSDNLDLKVWSGIVPDNLIAGMTYNYRLELQMYEGSNSIMHIDTPALMRI